VRGLRALLEGCWVNGTPRYRCRLTAGDYARNTDLAARHGKCPSVREDRLTRARDALLVRVLDPANAAQVAEAIAAAAPGAGAADARAEAARRTFADADERLTRYRAALDSGGDPAVVGGWIAEAAADKAQAEQDLRALGTREQVTAGHVLELLDRLGPIGERLAAADPVLKARAYSDLGLKIAWCPGESRGHVSVTPALPGGVYVRRVGGPTSPMCDWRLRR
jgi:hypothetical protein